MAAEPPSSDHRQEAEMNYTKSSEKSATTGVEMKLRPPTEHAPKCPRCDSDNTKFCYYNNYSQSQPRYFCKSCRRYWTKGGTLRNVPIGGGCRKNKRSVKRSLDRIDLLLQSQMENNDNLLIGSSTSSADHHHHQSLLLTNKATANFSNLSSSSPLSYESSGSGESCLSMAFATLQKQCDLGLGFGFPIFANYQVNHHLQDSRTNLGYFMSQPMTSNFNTQISFENHGRTGTHTQPLLPFEDQLSCLDLMSSGGGSVKQDEAWCDNRKFPWQMGGCLSSLENDYINFNNNNNNNNNLVLGSISSDSTRLANGYEFVAGGRENESAEPAAPSWPANLINTSVLL